MEKREGEVVFETSLEALHEGFEDSAAVNKEHDSLHTHLPQEAPSDQQKESHDVQVTSPDTHVTTTSTLALTHLTNDILTYSSQVATTTQQEESGSVSKSKWLRSSSGDGIPRSASPMAVNRVFKVVFLGEKIHREGGREGGRERVRDVHVHCMYDTCMCVQVTVVWGRRL